MRHQVGFIVYSVLGGKMRLREAYIHFNARNLILFNSWVGVQKESQEELEVKWQAWHPKHLIQVKIILQSQLRENMITQM